MTAVRVRIRIRKYVWHDFVHDMYFVLYGSIILSDALFRRYLKRSLPDFLDTVYKNTIVAVLLIGFGIGGIARYRRRPGHDSPDGSGDN